MILTSFIVFGLFSRNTRTYVKRHVNDEAYMFKFQLELRFWEKYRTLQFGPYFKGFIQHGTPQGYFLKRNYAHRPVNDT